ncbi:MAG: DNA/RNA non-specific endonuclease [Acidobacteriota bacterium]
MNLRRSAVMLLLCLGFLAQSVSAASTGIVISQVYGGGGNSGATYKNDFIELFNRGTSPVDVTGWSVQYASAAGTTWATTALSGTIQPGQYYLVQEAAGAGGTADLPTPDATGGISMSASNAKVALVNNITALSGACPTGVVDFIGFGTANCSEGTAVAPLTNTTAALRNGNGCTDTDSNSGDFSIGVPTPRNSASPLNSCAVVNAPPTISAPADPAASVSTNDPPFTVSLSGTDDGGVYDWSATAGTGISAVVVTSGQGTANVTYTVTLQSGFSGIATFTASLSDGVNPPASRAVNIQVDNPAVNSPPAISAPSNPITTVEQDAPAFTVNLSAVDDNNLFTWSATPGTGVSTVSVSGGQGTGTVTYTVLLQSGFNGTATFTAALTDGVNAPVTQAVNIAVNPPPPPLDHLVINQIYGGGGNSGAIYRNDFIELFNPTTSAVDIGGWTVQYSSATGSFSQIQPLGGIIQPGEFYLIALASGGATGAPLPVANSDGSFNMSATAGKVALVSGGDLLDTCSDAAVVDLVGYGTTANCREGSTNAPAASNTTSLFRKNGGFTDTNVNGNDFVTGAPNPRRTAAITEIGPYVLNVDPRNNSTTAPRDASITVTFTEPVDITGSWYNISCATTGLHNDATMAGGPTSWVVTPNVNFLPGEQCTVTIFKDSIHDQDTDDSLPNSDTLTADYIWSFSVATGTAPPEPPSVHLTMGNPTDAMASLSLPNNYLMEKPEYALSYNRDRGTPNWVSWHLTDEWVGTLTRVDTFRPDPAVPPDWYRVQAFDYFTSGFDRGHMTPNADRDKETSIPINQATFLMSNMVPQSPDNNQGPWANLENYLRTLLPADELYIVSGPAGIGGSGSSGFMTTIASGRVTVPSSTWKVAIILPKDSGDDVSRVTASTRTIAVIMPNVQGIRNVDWHTYLTTIDQVEALTGYDFFANVDDFAENCIEGATDGVNDAPCVATSSLSMSPEGTPVTVTANAADPDGDTTLSYTWAVTKNGSAYGSGAGTSSFTFTPDDDGNYVVTLTVSDGNGGMTEKTNTISVTNVAPVITGTTGPAGALALGSPATVTVNYTDAGSADTHTAVFNWDDGSSSTVACSAGVCSASRTYAAAGVYGVAITVADDDNGVATTTFNYIVVVDSTDAKVTGGGWINSPAGAYTLDSTLSGKASFNVNSKYKKKSTEPEGNTSFSIGSLNFQSTSYDWLVIAGAKAQYRGTGTINGLGAYAFLLTVTDSDIAGSGPDRLRIRIWDKTSGVTVYDNVVGSPDDIDTANPQTIGGGNITVH